GAGVLADFDLSGECGDAAILANVQPGADFVGELRRLDARTRRGFLQRESLFGYGEYRDARAHEFEEVAPMQRKLVNGACRKFVAFRLEGDRCELLWKFVGDSFVKAAHWACSRTALAAR